MARLEGLFDTRREAEMAVERLVQEHEIDRRSVEIAPAGPANSAGEQSAGSDKAAGGASPPAREDAALEGGIVVSVDVPDAAIETVRAAFREFAGDQG